MLSQWQDLAFALTGVAFAISLVPTIINQFRQRATTVSLTTSGLTCLALPINFTAFYTLGLWWSAAITAVVFSLWLTILVQGLRYYVRS